MSDTRERILDALEAVIGEAGPVGATLEAVAARAGVSKGGLLYHFGTKEALYSGLLDRLRHLGAEDAIAGTQGSPVAAYLATSSSASDAYTQTLMAVLRLIGSPGLDVEGAVRESLDHWPDLLSASVRDPLLLRLITLVGDGLYFRALVAADSDPRDRDLVAYLQGLVSREG